MVNSRYLICGGNTLNGEITIQSSKNAVLPIFAASILAEEKVVIHKVPDITDSDNMLKILITLGCKVKREGSTVIIDSSTISSGEIPSGLARELRSSVFLLGSILARMKTAKVAYPGGCDIGIRPIDIHLKGLKALNVNIKEGGGYIYCDASDMKGADIHFDFPSVGATENIMLAATSAKGETIIRNAAKEPEIVDLQNFLRLSGVNIQGAGTGTIVIQGTEKFNGCEYTAIPDRIVTGTYLIAGLMCGGNLILKNTEPLHIQSLISKLKNSACRIDIKNDKIIINNKRRMLAPELIETMPYPAFPTDLQAPVMSLASISNGTTVIIENMFETRFKHVPELVKMGAKITVRDKAAYVRGVKQLYGAEVKAYDLRGGAALVLAGLAANGYTNIENIYHIDRGYEDLEGILTSLGAAISRI